MYFDLQKASMLKRISARILDMIVVSILATGFALLVSTVIGYDTKYEQMNKKLESYQTMYDVDMDLTNDGYASLSEEERAKYDAASAAMSADEELAAEYANVLSMSFTILSIGLLLAYAVSDFVIPLFLKQGQTIGKKIFGLCLMQTDHTKLKTWSLAIRTFIGKFTIETMVPLLICSMIFFGFLGIAGTVTLVLLLIVQIVILVKTETNSVIHDVFAQTVVVDEKSQKIFEDAAEKDEYKNKYSTNR